MSTSIRLISSCALLGLGLSGLVSCYDGTAISDDQLEQTGTAQEEAAQPADPQEPETDVIVEEAPVINVLNVTCIEPEDPDGMDEPSLVINGQTVWAGAGFVAGTSQEVAYEERAFGSVVVIEVREQDIQDDFSDPNDVLGRFEIPAGEMGDGPQIAEVKDNGGSYELVYQVDSCTNCEPGEQPNL